MLQTGVAVGLPVSTPKPSLVVLSISIAPAVAEQPEPLALYAEPVHQKAC
jgi:hypothetical protein